MEREYWAVLIGGVITLILRTGDLLLKWFAKRLGVYELPEYKIPPPPTAIPPSIPENDVDGKT